jgi:beta-galactosidase/beta-glucuronidase
MTNPATTRIRVASKFFFEGDRKFFIKGVTYGRPEQVDVDLRMMREIGINVVRVYHVPPDWFLERCVAIGMRVLITLPWEKHIEFLREKKVRAEIGRMVRATVKRYAGNPAVLAYLVGNEISSTMARWLGVRQVIEFVEHLVRIGRSVDPNVLFSYATFPPTEYLLPQNVDFFCFNVYLHNQRDFERYLLRLQNLTEERPLILGEFGGNDSLFLDR